MTPEELEALPLGTIIVYYGDLGEIVRAGAECHVLWPGYATTIMYTRDEVWRKFIADIELET